MSDPSTASEHADTHEAAETAETPAPAESVPGPDGLPVVGSFFDVRDDSFAFRERVAREYGGVARYDVLGSPVYLLTDPAAIERVLVSENQHYRKGDLFQRQLGPVLGDGLLTSEGAFWRRQRHLVQPAFGPDRIAGYADTMVDRTVAATDGWRDGEVRDVHTDTMGLTLDIVARTLLGVDIGARRHAVGGALDAVMDAAAGSLFDLLPEGVPTPGRVARREAVATLDRIVDELVAEKRADPGEDVVTTLLRAEDESGEPMSDEQVRDEVKTLLLAGHETTALSLTFTLHLLARRPTVEARVVDELDETLGGDDPSLASVDDLPYLERVVKESMRLFPPVHGILREPTRDVELGGYRIPAGSPLSISQWVVHRDPAVYDDPLAFRPDRWTPEFERSLPPLAYFPFAAGPRRCIGDRFAMLEARLVLATLLRRYHFELVSPEELDLVASITSRPTTPVRMRVHEREE
ncbi:cytochrome P450 [Candidatus Halobonum tyrrellensis]|uniref:Cytochrome P450 n=1 Tax=Candidatus Halobonum tyrrellensis G22 TaxID=1324957 RepID=V4HEX5_9EURY|nr:cytochrome P450 [Candidatus Halobonum tyrrellensis]ESP88673.1 cytochrome P450 [Candidatus Halobonum tyrrellensis G22]